MNPGGLLPDVNLEALLVLHRIHVRRNPRTVRVLVDHGIVREQGEGILYVASFTPVAQLAQQTLLRQLAPSVAWI